MSGKEQATAYRLGEIYGREAGFSAAPLAKTRAAPVEMTVLWVGKREQATVNANTETTTLLLRHEEIVMDYETLLCEVQGQIATVTLNRPKVLHALNAQVFDELEAVFLALKADAAVRVILLTGSGEKAFAAGAGSVSSD